MQIRSTLSRQAIRPRRSVRPQATSGPTVSTTGTVARKSKENSIRSSVLPRQAAATKRTNS